MMWPWDDQPKPYTQPTNPRVNDRIRRGERWYRWNGRQWKLSDRTKPKPQEPA